MTSTGIIFDIKRFAIRDGPGIRTTIFLKGCPLNCLWCHNPEGIYPKQEIMFKENRCIDCGKCSNACEINVLERFKKSNKDEECLSYKKYIENCPTNALVIIGKYMTVDEIMEKILRDKIFYKNSGGGVTVSGGEPLFQPDFTREILRRCKEEGINTVLDTCGYASHEKLESILEYTDLVLFDIKIIDPMIHKQIIGVDNTSILNNAKKILEKDMPIIFRIPIILGITDTRNNINNLVQFIHSLKRDNIKHIDLLPYHNWGKIKYEYLGKKYLLSEENAPKKNDLELVRKRISETGVNIRILEVGG